MHMYPELSFKEVETTKYIVARLEEIEGVENIRTGKAHIGLDTGVVASIFGRAPHAEDGPIPVMLLRADIDALEMEEVIEDEWRSRHPNVAHTCGHDRLGGGGMLVNTCHA